MGPTHRKVAAAAWLGAATAAGLPGWQVAAGVIPAVALSSGQTSPDIDLSRGWRRLDRWLPDELLGDGGPLQHRGIAHWVGWPLLAAWALWAAPAWQGTWVLWALILGWASHIAADTVFGQAGYGIRQGVPLAPWWWHIGVGLDATGLASALFGWMSLVAAVAWSIPVPAVAHLAVR